MVWISETGKIRNSKLWMGHERERQRENILQQTNTSSFHGVFSYWDEKAAILGLQLNQDVQICTKFLDEFFASLYKNSN